MKSLLHFLLLLQLSVACIPYNRDPELDATLEKLYTANEQLHTSIGFYRSRTSLLIQQMQSRGEENPESTIIIQALGQAIKMHQKTNEVVSTLDLISRRIVELSGGYNGQGRLVGGLDHAYHQDYTLGIEGKQVGAAYELAKKLRDYDSFLRTLNPKLPLPKIKALSSEGDAVDFANFHFNDTPAITCLMTLATIEWEVARNEYEATLYLAKQIGHS